LFLGLDLMNKILLLLQKTQPIVMGILNATPDSFSDGGLFTAADKACEHALLMQRQGADIIDVGGESTRPGAADVSLEDELTRVIPVIESIRQQSDIVISIDTSKPDVMQAALDAGADMVNDVNALQADGAVKICAVKQAVVCLMHMQGQPRTMQNNPCYDNVVTDIQAFLEGRIDVCLAAGIKKNNIVLDAGFGFGKTLGQNYSLLKHLNEFLSLGYPLLVGISRKSMLGEVIQQAAEQRLYASVAANVLAYTQGAKIFRVHDVQATVEALKIAQAMMNAS